MIEFDEFLDIIKSGRAGAKMEPNINDKKMKEGGFDKGAIFEFFERFSKDSPGFKKK